MTVSQLESPVFPVRFDLSIPQFSEVVLIGDWLVGYEPDWTVSGSDRYFGESTMTQPELLKWLEGMYQSAPRAMDQEARRWLARHGAFRNSDWYEAKKLLSNDSLLPQEVRAEIRRSKASRVYVIHIDDFRCTWTLLESVALILGKLAEGEKLAALTRDLNFADEILRKSWHSVMKPPERISLVDFDLDGEEGQLERETSASSLSRPKPGPSKPLPLAYKVGQLIEGVFLRAFGERARLRLRYRYPKAPTFIVYCWSTLELACAIIVANFGAKWRRCARQGCGNLFLYRGRGKQYCEWYCAHLDWLRTKRKEVRRKRGGKR